MVASSNNTISELRLCDAGSEHPHLSESSGLAPHSPSGEIDDCIRIFNCSICMQISQEPVVTMCGHLFCWPCLYYHLSLHSACKACPVCKTDVQGKIVPLYGCGRVSPSLAEKLHGVHIPCRPLAIAHSTTRQSMRHHAIPRIPPQDAGGLLGRYMQGAASLLMRRRRFNNEKEFVLHWVFILVASATIAFFLAW